MEYHKLLQPFLYALHLFQVLKVPRDVYNNRPLYLHKVLIVNITFFIVLTNIPLYN